jgi:hypothetical protein
MVAIQCRGGSSLGDLFVFDGPLEPSDRCAGRRLAFGVDVEILKADSQGAATRQELDTAGYNKLLTSTAFQGSDGPSL